MKYTEPNSKTPPPSFPRRRESSLVKEAWLNLARERLKEICENKVDLIPSEIVFDRIDKLLSK